MPIDDDRDRAAHSLLTAYRGLLVMQERERTMETAESVDRAYFELLREKAVRTKDEEVIFWKLQARFES